MKRWISLLLALSCLCVCLASCSSDNTEDGGGLVKPYSLGLAYEACEDDPSQCVITGIGSCTDKNIVIPAYINGMRVRAIADGAFSTKTQTVKGMATGSKLSDAKVESLVAKPEIHTVERLSDADASTSEEKPTYSTIGGIGVGNIEGIIGGSGVPGYEFHYVITDYGEGYVTGDTEPIALEDVESVQIPTTVTTIGEEAFYGCEELGTITAHRAVSSIGKDAFLETAYYNDPANWDGQALYLSTFLLSVSYAFSGEFTVRDGTTMIADRAFSNCQNLTYVSMADTVSAVGNYAFVGCASLLYVDYSKVKTYTVGTGAYEGCISYQQYHAPFGDNGERYPSTFYAIEQTQFENVKEILPVCYTCEVRNAGRVTYWRINGDEVYYKSDAGETTQELYVIPGENGPAVYIKREGGLYATTDELPTHPWIPEQITYEALTYTEEKGLYVYEGDDGLRVELGFVNGRLAYLCSTSEGETVEVYYYDENRTSIPNPPPIVGADEGV